MAAEPGQPPDGPLGEDDRSALAAWAQLPACGPATLWRVRAAGDVAERFADLRGGRLPMDAPRRSVARGWLDAAASIDPGVLADRRHRAGIHLSVFGDESHPPSCWMDPFVPPLLFLRGGAPVRSASDVPTVAIVGTRRATRVGLDIAHDLAAQCGAAGIRVASGLALGIDGAAHRGALTTSSPHTAPVAVVGSGPDRPYPVQHRDLWYQIADVGVVVSEYPPGTAPARWRFPARNRLLAGLADVIVVVESRARGGSLGTAQMAAERGVPVLAVPGSIRSPESDGTNALLADGAHPCRGIDDVVCAAGLVGVGERAAMMSVDVPTDRTVEERDMLDALGWEPRTLEELVAGCRLGDGELATALLTLQVDGLVRATGGSFARVHHSVRDS